MKYTILLLYLILTSCSPEAELHRIFGTPKFKKGDCYIATRDREYYRVLHYIKGSVDNPFDYITCQINRGENEYYACKLPLFGWAWVDVSSRKIRCPYGLVQSPYDPGVD